MRQLKASTPAPVHVELPKGYAKALLAPNTDRKVRGTWPLDRVLRVEGAGASQVRVGRRNKDALPANWSGGR